MELVGIQSWEQSVKDGFMSCVSQRLPYTGSRRCETSFIISDWYIPLSSYQTLDGSKRLHVYRLYTNQK